MTVEYSDGYKQRAAERLEQIEASMTPHAREVSKLMSEYFQGFTKGEKIVKDPERFKPVWLVIYTHDRKQLDVTDIQAWRRNRHGLDIASIKQFETKIDAMQYAMQLGKKHGISCRFNGGAVLDADD